MNETRYHLPYLRAWREHRELSQAQLAERAGIGRATIARLEASKTEANGVTVTKLSRGLDLARDDLLHTSPEKQAAPVVTKSRKSRRRAALSGDAAMAQG